MTRPAGGGAADPVRRWADALVRAARAAAPVPRYGTPAWCALPAGDPGKLAGLVAAAEAWRQHCSPEQVAADLAAELEYIDWSVRMRLAEASHDISRAGDWHAMADQPTHAELQRRRSA